MGKKPRIYKHKKQDTSWQHVAKWYRKAVGEYGLYYHRHVIIPKSLELLDLKADSSVLDLGCGEGVFSRYIDKNIYYLGIDRSESLIKYAKQSKHSSRHKFDVADITAKLPIKKNDFTHAVIILAIQNIDDIAAVFRNVNYHLQQGGKFLIVLNHPYFRIPRQTSWGIDESKKLQYRRVDRYLTELKIPIHMHPGKDASIITWSFHRPLSTYVRELTKNGFVVSAIEEWVSDKVSVGKASRMENRARQEFPLFMAILAIKQNHLL